MPLVVEALQKGLECIQEPKNWCKHSFYQLGEDGDIQYCALGALENIPGAELACYYLAKAAKEIGYTSIVAMNDSPLTSHMDVIARFRRAIELAAVEEDTDGED